MRFRELIVNIFLFNYVHCYFIKDRTGSAVDIYNSSIVKKPINYGTLPDYFDWREGGFVSPVKDQLSCGACWAFSSNIESHIKIYLNKNVILSEQFLIDCEVAGTGCKSTTVLIIFAEIVSIFGGVLLDSDYHPYTGQAESCRWNRTPQPVPVVGFRRVPPDEAIMVDYLYKFGPLSTAINSASMHNYIPKTIDDPSTDTCPPDNLDHAVLIVGYNSFDLNYRVQISENKTGLDWRFQPPVQLDQNTGKVTPYWIIKNSWGTEWGDKGYYYLVRGRNACGVATDVSMSIVN